MAFAINRERIRDCLEEWASESEQRRLWLSDGSGGAEVSSFDEASECLFSDTGLHRELEKGRAVFNPQIDEMLFELNAKLRTIDRTRPPVEIIRDEKMKEVRLLAAQLLEMIAAQQGWADSGMYGR